MWKSSSTYYNNCRVWLMGNVRVNRITKNIRTYKRLVLLFYTVMASFFIILFTLYLVLCILMSAEQVFNRNQDEWINMFYIALQFIVNILSYLFLFLSLEMAIFYLK